MNLKKVFFSVGLFICFLQPATAQIASSLFQIAPLVPKDSELVKITSVSSWANIIDGAILEILASPTGSLICGAIPDNDLILQRSFFLLSSSVLAAKKICANKFAKKWTGVPFAKTYFFILTEDSQNKVDGWTTPRNETFIFLDKNEKDVESRIKQTLTHELAISYDQKEQLGFFGGFTDASLLGLTPDENSCLLHAIVRRPSLKHTLATLRAFDMEAAISRELGLKLQEGFANWNDLTCVEKFEFMNPYIAQLAQALAAESLVSQFLDSNIYTSQVIGKTDLELIKILAQINLKFQNGSSQNACDFLSKGLPFWPGLSHNGGPGPRIGGGGWLTLDEIRKKKQEPKKSEQLGPSVNVDPFKNTNPKPKPTEGPHVITEPRP